MQNRDLTADYLKRCEHRLAAIDTLLERESWLDVVRESQKIVELALKGLLRFSGIEVPRVHDVSQILLSQGPVFPDPVRPHLDRLSDISRRLRRDRELSFYGSEDLTPSEFYKRADAEEARSNAQWVVSTLSKIILKPGE